MLKNAAGKTQLQKQRGFALVITLWVMAVLGVMAASFSYEALCETKVESWSSQDIRAYNLARGGIHRAAGIVREHARDQVHSITDKWFSGESLYKDVQLGTGYYSIIRPVSERSHDSKQGKFSGRPAESKKEKLQYGLVDEESRLNINVATMDQLQGFPDVSNVLASNIILYRTKKQNKDPKATPPSVAITQGLVDGPILIVDELLQVKGMTREILYGTPDGKGGIAQHLTCFSSGKVNINTAGKEVLHAVGFTTKQVQALLAYRLSGWKGFATINAAISALGAAGQESHLSPVLGVQSKNFSMTCLAGFSPGKPVERIIARVSVGKNQLRFTRWESEALPRR
ncbi:type II secretion system protein GspK [Maridesulfovibrio sp.]|uniref:general secretion pathway protein GspK n=1 Tax=Maridesulfovibrio sp. TaxID=2795000 RepID=UPI0029F4AE17|nr:type II secretion system protein GspK [Maridesulfovibrio sp.]